MAFPSVVVPFMATSTVEPRFSNSADSMAAMSILGVIVEVEMLASVKKREGRDTR